MKQEHLQTLIRFWKLLREHPDSIPNASAKPDVVFNLIDEIDRLNAVHQPVVRNVERTAEIFTAGKVSEDSARAALKDPEEPRWSERYDTVDQLGREVLNIWMMGGWPKAYTYRETINCPEQVEIRTHLLSYKRKPTSAAQAQEILPTPPIGNVIIDVNAVVNKVDWGNGCESAPIPKKPLLPSEVNRVYVYPDGATISPCMDPCLPGRFTATWTQKGNKRSKHTGEDDKIYYYKSAEEAANAFKGSGEGPDCKEWDYWGEHIRSINNKAAEAEASKSADKNFVAAIGWCTGLEDDKKHTNRARIEYCYHLLYDAAKSGLSSCGASFLGRLSSGFEVKTDQGNVIVDIYVNESSAKKHDPLIRLSDLGGSSNSLYFAFKKPTCLIDHKDVLRAVIAGLRGNFSLAGEIINPHAIDHPESNEAEVVFRFRYDEWTIKVRR